MDTQYEDFIKKVVQAVNQVRDEMSESAAGCPIPLGISNRHIHLSQQDLEALFGSGYQLTNIKELVQPGQYVAKKP